MGFFEALCKLFGFTKREVNVLLIGLDNSGKTTILDQMRPSGSQSQEIAPTVGLNVEKIDRKEFLLTCFDMAGQGRYRSLWEHYYKDCDAIIFVVDSADKLRLVVAQDELEQLLSHKEIMKKRLPLLFYANKMDIPGALTASQMAQILCLDKIRDKSWNINATNGLSGEGIENGTNWLVDQLRLKLASK